MFHDFDEQQRRYRLHRPSPPDTTPATPASEDHHHPTPTLHPILQDRQDHHDTHTHTHVPRSESMPHIPSAPSTLRHARIDSIRTSESHLRSSLRELSPARSVRWADTGERSGGPNTPRFMSPSASSTPLPGSEAPSGDEGGEREGEEEGDDSPRNQVRFQLPGAVDKRG